MYADERARLDFANAVWEFVTRGADARDEAAAKRHQELMRATEQGFERLNKTLEKGLRDLADALRAYSR